MRATKMVPSTPMSEQIPLSVLIDRVAQDEVTDRAFVRGLALWLHQVSPRLELDLVEALGLLDVVVTFKMTQQVKLIITGRPPGALPGEVTVSVEESDFPHIQARVLDDDRDEPYEFCTLDYALKGMPVRVVQGAYKGQDGVLLVAATIGGRARHRVQLGPRVLTFDEAALEPLA